MLARTERVRRGLYRFTCYAAPDVTLEADLLRRDLTVNALARGCRRRISTRRQNVSVSACCHVSRV